MENAARIVTGAMLGMDGETVEVGGRLYYIKPPTIKKIMGCGYYLTSFGDEKRVADYFREMSCMGDACKALSWLIQGDELLAGQLEEGTLDEVVDALERGLSLIDTKGFRKLSVLSRSVQSLTARQR